MRTRTLTTLAALAFAVGTAAGTVWGEPAAPADFRGLGRSLGGEVVLPGNITPGPGRFGALGRGLTVGGAGDAIELLPVPCLPRQPMAAYLARKWGEIPIWRGVQAGALLQLFVSPGGTWTVVYIKPGDRCATMIHAGEGSQLLLGGDPA